LASQRLTQEDDQIDPELRKNLLALSEHDVNIIEGYGLVKNNNPAHSRGMQAETVSSDLCAGAFVC
jgi:hypothetical protein